jgi:hypothetical protein
MRKHDYINIIIMVFLPLILSSQKNPIELGDVHWLRSMEEAQAKSKSENKIILILFQEIPGCQTCQTYGSEVLTHPLIVETIEEYFIPLAIYNNKPGPDAEVLKRYNEPAWNNPVVRAVDLYGKDVAVKLNGNYSTAGLASWMTKVLISTRGRAPQYLQLLTDELMAGQRRTATATYSMYCFWTGEALFGKLNGVLQTTAGFQDGKEVVTVVYDPAVITKAELDKIAQQKNCSIAGEGSFRPDATPKYYLNNSPYNVVPMTEIQKCRVNSALADSQQPDDYLSKRQLAFLKTSKKNCLGLSLRDGWKEAGKK